MATRKKTTPTPTSPAGDTLPGFGDLGKMFEGFKLPGIDIAALAEAQRKDMEALAEANRLAYEGFMSLAERRNELMAESLSELQESMAAATEPDAWSKQAALAKERFERAMSNMRELAEMEAETRKKAWNVVKDRFLENQANLMNLFKPK
jgi:phasin family protein